MCACMQQLTSCPWHADLIQFHIHSTVANVDIRAVLLTSSHHARVGAARVICWSYHIPSIIRAEVCWVTTLFGGSEWNNAQRIATIFLHNAISFICYSNFAMIPRCMEFWLLFCSPDIGVCSRRQDDKLSLCYSADVAIKDLINNVTWTLGPVTLPFGPPLPDACHDQGLQCPLAPNVMANFTTVWCRCPNFLNSCKM